MGIIKISRQAVAVQRGIPTVISVDQSLTTAPHSIASSTTTINLLLDHFLNLPLRSSSGLFRDNILPTTVSQMCRWFTASSAAFTPETGSYIHHLLHLPNCCIGDGFSHTPDYASYLSEEFGAAPRKINPRNYIQIGLTTLCAAGAKILRPLLCIASLANRPAPLIIQRNLQIQPRRVQLPH